MQQLRTSKEITEHLSDLILNLSHHYSSEMKEKNEDIVNCHVNEKNGVENQQLLR